MPRRIATVLLATVVLLGVIGGAPSLLPQHDHGRGAAEAGTTYIGCSHATWQYGSSSDRYVSSYDYYRTSGGGIRSRVHVHQLAHSHKTNGSWGLAYWYERVCHPH